MVDKVDKALTAIEDYIDLTTGSNNIIKGSYNTIMGNDNIIIGDSNKLEGDDNWIISRDNYHGVVTNYLVYEKWAIDLSDKRNILKDPSTVIKGLDRKVSPKSSAKCMCSQMRTIFRHHYH